MAGTKVVAVKQGVIAGLQGLTGTGEDLEGVSVEYAWKPNQTKRERIFCGRANGTHAPANMKAGRTHRTETVSFELTVLVEKPGGSAEDAEARAVELGTVVEEWVADNRASIAGAMWVVAEGEVTLTSLFSDSGHLAELVYTLAYHAYLD